MDLLEFARGPALEWAAYILVAGTTWRIAGILLLREKQDLSDPRQRAGLGAALKLIWTRNFAAPAFRPATLYPKMLAYVMHIGLLAVVFLFVPHIMFFEGFLGFSWPGLPNSVIYILGAQADLELRRLLQLADCDAAAGDGTPHPAAPRGALRDLARHPHPERRRAHDLVAVRQTRAHVPRVHNAR